MNMVPSLRTFYFYCYWTVILLLGQVYFHFYFASLTRINEKKKIMNDQRKDTVSTPEFVIYGNGKGETYRPLPTLLTMCICLAMVR
jgi:hypothetical protein